MKIIAIVAAAAVFCGTTFSQGVPDGSDWTFPDGTTCTVDVVDSNPDNPSCTVQITDATGSTTATTGAAGADSTTDKPTCESAPARSTTGGSTFRIKSNMPKKSKVQKQNADGTFVNGRQTRRKKGGTQQQGAFQLDLGPENEGTSLPD